MAGSNVTRAAPAQLIRKSRRPDRKQLEAVLACLYQLEGLQSVLFEVIDRREDEDDQYCVLRQHVEVMRDKLKVCIAAISKEASL